MFETISNVIRKTAFPISRSQPVHQSFVPILEAIGDVEIVMIGEASHGTHEFYQYRAELTKQLITEKGFTFICCEADWPDAYRVNRYMQKGKHNRDNTAEESLCDFKRFPMWMWRNTVVRDFTEWLRNHNEKAETSKDKVAFYGMDLYSFFTSMDEVIEYLEKVDPKDAKIAKKRYGNFERFQGEPHAYGKSAGFGISKSFEKEVVATLVDLRKKEEQYLKGAGGLIDGDELFYTQVNAEIVKNAEEYYRKMYHADESTWNLRDKHMVDVVSSLLTFHKKKFPERKEKVIIWAHNSHLGDARATDKGKLRGEWNVGQLIRERYGLQNTFNIGFTTYRGSVTAAKNWHKPAQMWRVRNGMYGSYEHLLHLATEGTSTTEYFMLFRSNKPNSNDINVELLDELMKERNERYIGVVYRPDTEKASHYSKKCCLPKEYDCVIHIDETTALEPLDITEPWDSSRKEITRCIDDDKWPELDKSLPQEQDRVEWRLRAAFDLRDKAVKLFELNNFEFALQKFDKSLHYLDIYPIKGHEYDNLRGEILMGRAECYYQLGQWHSVQSDCLKALQMTNSNAMQIHLILGRAYEKQGETQKSKVHYHAASEIAAQEVRRPATQQRG